jgi:CDP-paratose 2-epimerase
VNDERPGDVPIYISDCARARSIGGWSPSRSARRILEDIYGWIDEHRDRLEQVLGASGDAS